MEKNKDKEVSFAEVIHSFSIKVADIISNNNNYNNQTLAGICNDVLQNYDDIKNLIVVEDNTVDIKIPGSKGGDVIFGHIQEIKFLLSLLKQSDNKQKELDLVLAGVGSGKSYFQNTLLPNLIEKLKQNDKWTKPVPLLFKVTGVYNGASDVIPIDSNLKITHSKQNEYSIVERYNEFQKKNDNNGTVDINKKNLHVKSVNFDNQDIQLLWQSHGDFVKTLREYAADILTTLAGKLIPNMRFSNDELRANLLNGTLLPKQANTTTDTNSKADTKLTSDALKESFAYLVKEPSIYHLHALKLAPGTSCWKNVTAINSNTGFRQFAQKLAKEVPIMCDISLINGNDNNKEDTVDQLAKALKGFNTGWSIETVNLDQATMASTSLKATFDPSLNKADLSLKFFAGKEGRGEKTESIIDVLCNILTFDDNTSHSDVQNAMTTLEKLFTDKIKDIKNKQSVTIDAYNVAGETTTSIAPTNRQFRIKSLLNLLCGKNISDEEKNNIETFESIRELTRNNNNNLRTNSILEINKFKKLFDHYNNFEKELVAEREYHDFIRDKLLSVRNRSELITMLQDGIDVKYSASDTSPTNGDVNTTKLPIQSNQQASLKISAPDVQKVWKAMCFVQKSSDNDTNSHLKRFFKFQIITENDFLEVDEAHVINKKTLEYIIGRDCRKTLYTATPSPVMNEVLKKTRPSITLKYSMNNVYQNTEYQFNLAPCAYKLDQKKNQITVDDKAVVDDIALHYKKTFCDTYEHSTKGANNIKVSSTIIFAPDSLHDALLTKLNNTKDEQNNTKAKQYDFFSGVVGKNDDPVKKFTVDQPTTDLKNKIVNRESYIKQVVKNIISSDNDNDKQRLISLYETLKEKKTKDKIDNKYANETLIQGAALTSEKLSLLSHLEDISSILINNLPNIIAVTKKTTSNDQSIAKFCVDKGLTDILATPDGEFANNYNNLNISNVLIFDQKAALEKIDKILSVQNNKHNLIALLNDDSANKVTINNTSLAVDYLKILNILSTTNIDETIQQFGRMRKHHDFVIGTKFGGDLFNFMNKFSSTQKTDAKNATQVTKVKKTIVNILDKVSNFTYKAGENNLVKEAFIKNIANFFYNKTHVKLYQKYLTFNNNDNAIKKVSLLSILTNIENYLQDTDSLYAIKDLDQVVTAVNGYFTNIQAALNNDDKLTADNLFQIETTFKTKLLDLRLKPINEQTQKQLQELQKTMETHRQQLKDDLKTLAATKETEIKKLHTEYTNKLNTMNDEFNKKLNNDELTKTAEELNKQLEELKTQYNKKVEQLGENSKKAIGDCSKTIKGLKETIEKLKEPNAEELGKLNKQLAELKTKINTANVGGNKEGLSKLKTQLEELKTQYNKKVEQWNDASQKAIEDYNKTITELKETIKNLKEPNAEELDNLNKQLAELQTKIDAAGGAGGDDTGLSNLKTQLEELKTQYETKVKGFKTASQNAIEELTKQITELQTKIEDLKEPNAEELGNLKTQLEELQTKIEDLKEPNAENLKTLKTQLEELGKQYETKVKGLDENSKKAIEDYNKTIKELQTKINTANVGGNKEGLSKLNEQLEELQTKINTANVGGNKEGLSKLNEQLEELQTQYNKKVEQLDENSQKAIEELTKQITELQTKIEDLKEPNVEELDKLNKQLEGLEKQYETKVNQQNVRNNEQKNEKYYQDTLITLNDLCEQIPPKPRFSLRKIHHLNVSKNANLTALKGLKPKASNVNNFAQGDEQNNKFSKQRRNNLSDVFAVHNSDFWNTRDIFDWILAFITLGISLLIQYVIFDTENQKSSLLRNKYNASSSVFLRQANKVTDHLQKSQKTNIILNKNPRSLDSLLSLSEVDSNKYRL